RGTPGPRWRGSWPASSCASCSSRRAATSGRARARPTRRSSIPASTPSRALSRPASCPAATTSSSPTRTRSGSRSSAPARSSSPGAPRSGPGCPRSRPTRRRTGTSAFASWGPRSSTRASRASARAPRAPSRCPTSTSSARSPLPSPSRRRRSSGVELRRSEAVTGLARERDGWRVATAGGELRSRWIVNCAGLRSDELHRLAGMEGFTVTPRRGELIVFDKLSRGLVDHVILPVPTAKTKGVLVAPTVFGNLLLGPTAVDIEDKGDTAVPREGIEYLLAQGRRILPELVGFEVTATYAGLRAATEHGDYRIGADGERRYAWAGGIRSTGLTAAMAIAEHLRDALGAAGLPLRELPGGLPPVRMPNIGEAGPHPYADAER